MTPMKKTIILIGVWLGLLLLSACSTATPTSTPTTDLNPFRTEVAATVYAQVTQALAQTPSPTLIPSPTITPAPSPSATQAPSATSDTTSTSPQETSTSGTPGTPGTPTTDLAEWVSQSVTDGTVFEPGESFTITWRLRNAGTSTWTPDYLFRFYAGNAFGATQEIPLGQEVAPGATVDISIEMTAPTVVGDYRSDWVMSNEIRSNFNQPVFLEITVARPETATPTTAAAATATATP
ncbi:MAG: NBR1-Ig-like domain-containing protein [Anaerolineales bacterium]